MSIILYGHYITLYLCMFFRSLTILQIKSIKDQFLTFLDLAFYFKSTMCKFSHIAKQGLTFWCKKQGLTS